MELNLTHDVIRINATIFNGSVEQSIEQDYALPDYYPDIFKVLKSIINSSVYNCRISGQKLVIDGIVIVKIIYQSEADSKIHSFIQKYPFSKTVELKEEVSSPIISYSVSRDYVNCRVVNPKRIDLRGAVTIHIMVSDQQDMELLTDANGAGIQLLRGTVENINSRLSSTKQFTIEERFEVTPPVDEIVRFNTSTILTDCKVISNKLVTKGEIIFRMLYRSDNGEESTLETFTEKVQISQILDMPGVDEDYKCYVLFNNTDTDLKSETDEDGTTMYASFSITAVANAYTQKEVSYIKSAFSTSFETECETAEMTSENMLMFINTAMTSKQQIEADGFKSIIDFWASVDNISVSARGETLGFTAELAADIIAVDNEDNIAMLNKTISIEFELPADKSFADPSVDVSARITNISHELNDNLLNFEIEFKLFGVAFSYDNLRVISALNVDENNPKDKKNQSALTIYYADSGEHLWDISKKYNTSMDAIMNENSLESNTIENRVMLLIPIVE